MAHSSVRTLSVCVAVFIVELRCRIVMVYSFMPLWVFLVCPARAKLTGI